MIHLNDNIGLGAFQFRSRQPDGNSPATEAGRTGAPDGDFFATATTICSDVSPAVRGSTVARHAANVLSHICRDEP